MYISNMTGTSSSLYATVFELFHAWVYRGHTMLKKERNYLGRLTLINEVNYSLCSSKENCLMKQ